MPKTFPATSIERLRSEAARARRLPIQMPSGWFKSPIDPMALVSVFEPLTVKSGYVLRAYQFQEAGNGKGFVWAMPVDAEFPDPADCPKTQGVVPGLPKPPGALDNVMKAIGGDGSRWSYLCASILKRELAEFGAMWHGCNWSMHSILDTSPRNHAKEPAPESVLTEMVTPVDAWEWLKEEPNDWRPFVEQDGPQITVAFVTYTRLGSEIIYRHVDDYRAGDYRPKTNRQMLARGTAGFVF